MFPALGGTTVLTQLPGAIKKDSASSTVNTVGRNTLNAVTCNTSETLGCKTVYSVGISIINKVGNSTVNLVCCSTIGVPMTNDTTRDNNYNNIAG